jgi:OOP family OmpA-OmpF porin
MKKNMLFAALLFLSYVVPAAAQMQQSPWYAGISFGQSRAQDVCNDAALFGGVASCDHKDIAWRLLGGYQVNRSFAVEAGYHDLGKASVPGVAIKSNAWELLGVGFLPAGPVSLVGKLGLMRSNSKCQGCAVQTEETATNVTWGAGVQFEVTPRVAVRGEWQRYNNLGGGVFNAKFDVDAWTLGAHYRF